MNQSVLDEFLHLFFSRQTLLLIGGVFFLVRIINSVEAISRNSFYRRLLPILPEILSAVAIFAGALPVLEHEHLIIKGATALWCGYVAQRFHKILGQTFLGDDPRIAVRNTSRCSYCDASLAPTDIRCRNCGATTLRSLSVPPPAPPPEDLR